MATSTIDAPARLFTPLKVGGLTLPNRIMIAPMCQYSAQDGNAVDWHLIHLGGLAVSGAGMLCLEATAVQQDGRITPGCLGLYNDENQEALQRLVTALRSASPIRLAIQLSHAGRKSSLRVPWQGGTLITSQEGGWRPSGPSSVARMPQEPAPRMMQLEDVREVARSFARAAIRAREVGLDAIELHMAHGYLLHQFLSPVANRRDDAYGGSLENRMRLPLEVFRAVKDAVGKEMAIGARLSATDWVEGAWNIEQAVELATRLEAEGCDFLDISSGGISHEQRVTMKVGPGYQVPFAAEVRSAVNIPVVAVGLITQPHHAEAILEQGQADIIAFARGFLNDPRWPWRAAAELGATVVAPPQIWRALPYGHPEVFDRRPV